MGGQGAGPFYLCMTFGSISGHVFVDRKLMAFKAYLSVDAIGRGSVVEAGKQEAVGGVGLTTLTCSAAIKKYPFL